MLWAIFGALLMGCSDEEIANVETSSRNAIGFNVLSNAAETRATPTTNTNLKNTDSTCSLLRRMVLPSWERSTRNMDMTE